MLKTFIHNKPFKLEQGEELAKFQLAYHTYGRLNKAGDNVIWVCHALTGNSDVAEWWPGLFGKGKLFDPERYFIVCANVLGSCYGSTYALTTDPQTNKPYYHRFPLITIRDMVKAMNLLRQHLTISRIKLVIGGSLGGQQVLEWAILYPDIIEYAIPVATNAKHSPWGVAFNEAQRMAIEADPSWKESLPTAGLNGMKAARAIAMLSYRHYNIFLNKQSETDDDTFDHYRASSYLRYMGEKLSKRFNAFAYYTLSKAMDSHHVGRGRESMEKALASIKAQTLVISIDSDLLFPISEQEFLFQHIPNAAFTKIESIYGHDGFLVETLDILTVTLAFIENHTHSGIIHH